MKALLRPPPGQSRIGDVVVTMIARTGRNNDMVKVDIPRVGIRSVGRFRLFAQDSRTRSITADEFRTLPWQGSGKQDPEAHVGDLLAEAESAR